MSHNPAPDKRTAILDAAQKRFAHYGLHKVTMDEIAADLGISKAALYYYFTTKEEIFRQVIAREQQEFVERMQAIIGRDIAPSKKLYAYILHQLDFFDELVTLKLISDSDRQAPRPVLGDLFKAFSQAELKLMKTIIRQGTEAGEMQVDSTEKAATLIVHLLQGLRIRFFKIQLDTGADAEQHRLAKTEMKLFARLLLNGILRKN
jgi:TetR/AcrR family transcriptional repressor of mexJK operon